MQKLLSFSGDLKAYLAEPQVLLTDDARRCPFCAKPHRLRSHGFYSRFVILPGEDRAVEIPVQRLFCAHTGSTVSLLPDFCIPRRQHGAAVLGMFLEEYTKGKPLLAALRKARPDAPGHSVAQSLLTGFLAHAGPIRTYLAMLHARVTLPPLSMTGPRREVAALLTVLCLGFTNAAAALLRHGVELHSRLGIGLA